MKERNIKMAAKKEQEMIIKINRPQITKANITIVGETPLIVHAW